MPPSLAYGVCTSSCHLDLHSEIHQACNKYTYLVWSCFCRRRFSVLIQLWVLRFFQMCGVLGGLLHRVRAAWEKEGSLVSSSPSSEIYLTADSQFLLLLLGCFKPKTRVGFWFITGTVERWRWVLLNPHGLYTKKKKILKQKLQSDLPLFCFAAR